MRQQGRELDRNVRNIVQQEDKTKREVKMAAKKGDTHAVRIMARELVQSKKAKARIFNAKAQLHSVELQLQMQLSQAKVMGALQRSTQIMTVMNDLMKVPELAATMREMSKQMEKAGLIDEIVDDTMEGVLGGDDLEDETDEAVTDILKEVLGKSLDTAVTGKSTLVGKKKVAQDLDDVEEADDDLVQRLAGLKGQ
jgi:charged multivesicular body protein 3